VRIVLDTGIFVSALISRNTPPDILYSAWRKRFFDLITSDAQLEEMQRVFGYKKLQRFIQANEAALLLENVSSIAEVLTDLPSVIHSPDPNDNMIIATALKGDVDYLVSGDKKDLLSLGSVQKIPIITARRAVEYLGIVGG